MTGDSRITDDGAGGVFVVSPDAAQRIGDRGAFVLLNLLFIKHGRQPFSIMVGPEDPQEMLKAALQRLYDCGEIARVGPGQFQIIGAGIRTLQEHIAVGTLATAPAQGTA